MTIVLHDPRACELGEGPLWHPGRKQLFWFDILGKRLLSRAEGTAQSWQFSEHVSAAGWIDDDTLLIASESALVLFDIESGAHEPLVPLEADNPVTRSNDGRADPFGGFWIGTMGKAAEPGAGAIYRYFGGRLERLFSGLTIPNAICFAPDGRAAYFTDSLTHRIMRQTLDGAGWPQGEPELFVDLAAAGLFPDGAVVDSEGYLWVALWGASGIARFTPDGSRDGFVDLPVSQPSCPAFGGDGLTTLFVTTAREDLAEPSEQDGATFRMEVSVNGQREHQVVI